VVRDPRSHGWRGRVAAVRLGECLVRPGEAEVHVVERYRVGQVLDFLEKPFVSRVKRRIPIRMVRFCRST